MIKNPIEWLRNHFSPESPLSTSKAIKHGESAFYLTGGSAIRMWPSNDPRRPINANVTVAIKGVRSNFTISPVTVPVHIPALIATRIIERIHNMSNIDRYYVGYGVEHVSLHGNLHISRISTDNTKLHLLDIKGAAIQPNLWFIKQEMSFDDDATMQSSDGGALSMRQIIAANRTLVYRGKRIENIPLRVNKGKVLFLGEQYEFSNFEQKLLAHLEEKELMTPRGTIAIPKVTDASRIVYERAFHFLAKEIAEYNNMPFTEPIPAKREKLQIFEAE